MAQPNGTTTTLTGTVEAVNERGIKLQGAWLNLSKWKPLPLPTRGALVSVDVKDGRFLDRIDVLDGQDAHSEPQRAVAGPGARERLITRLACLRSAVQLAAGKGDLTSADVLKVAERFEAWVTRDGEGE
jgi:hypothetical protein